MHNIIVLTGPTASGKSDLAILLAKNISGTVLNADSMQIYKEVPIISAVPDKTDGIPHQLYSFLYGTELFSVSNWLSAVRNEIDRCHKVGSIPIIVGGTTMYIRLLIDGISEILKVDKHVIDDANLLMESIGKLEFHKKLSEIDIDAGLRIKPTDKQRMLRAYIVKMSSGTSIFDFHLQERKQTLMPDEMVHKVAIVPEREKIYNSCNSRFLDMINNGGIEEVEQLINLKYGDTAPIFRTIGVKEIASYIASQVSKDEMIYRATAKTRQYAKRQMTWIRNNFNDFAKLSDPSSYLSDIMNLIDTDR